MTQVQTLPLSRFQSGIEDFEDLYEHAPCGYLNLEPGGRIDRVNATFLAWTGHSLEELQGRSFQSLLNMAGKIFYETHFAPMLRLQGFFNEVALDLVAKDGTPIPILVNATERRDDDGRTISIRITVFNATDRRRYERELLAARNALTIANDELREVNEQLNATNHRLNRANGELHAFYETLPVGIFRTSTDGAIEQASRRFCALLGVETAEDWLTGIPEEDHVAIVPKWQQAIRTGAPFSHRFRVAADDEAADAATDGGEAVRHIEMKAIPIPGSEDGPVFVGVVEDVTERLHLETQKRQIDRHAIVRQLTGGLAHNLNGNLTIMFGSLEMLQDGLADRPRLQPVLKNGFVAAERAAAIVTRLLLYSGYTLTRSYDLEIDPFLKDVATSMVDRFSQNHRLTCDFRASGAVVEIGTNILQEALEELISNAVAAMPQGGEVHLSTRLTMQGEQSHQGAVVIAISDQGIGMDQATLTQAREPFYTQRDIGAGVGLGLSLVDGIARIAGGELKLHSNPGQGTTVELHLPLAQ